MKTLNKVKISIWINALSAIVIGILFLINPQESFQIITILAGIIITFTGIVDFIYYFSGWLDIYFMKNTLLSGILKCVLGIFVLTHISMMTTFFSYIFSLYIIISAIYCFEAYTFIKSMVSYSLTFDYIIVTILIFTGLAMFFLSPSTVISSLGDFGGNSDQYKLLSFFGSAEYSYNQKYFLSASVRSDGSSRFHPDHRWGTFWSVGASWKIMQEEFMKDTSDWLSNLSLRASYGAQGNDQVGYYAYQALYSIRNNLGESGLHAYRLATPNLSWETNLNTNIGLDFGFWNNRLNGTIEYFERRSKDLLFSKDLVPSSGFSSMDENIGAIKNYGWEFQISGYPIMTKDWKWKLSFNATTYKNKITSLPAEEMWSGNKKWVKGGSLYDFYLVEWAGVNPENGNPTWYRYNTNGEKITTEDYSSTTPDDKVKCGNSLPDWTGGLQSDLSFKDFTLSFLFSYSIGGKIYNGDKVSLMSQGPTGTSWSVDMLDRWTPENPYTDVPRLTTSPKSSWTNSSNRFLVDRSYLRLKNITFSYNLPKSLLNTLTLKDASIFFQAENMLTLAKQQGLDPEQTFGGSTYYRYPAMKTISFGINVKL